MSRKKQVYYYDTETCTYQPRKLSVALVTRKVAFFVLFAVVLAGGTIALFNQFLVDAKSSELHVENEALLAKLNKVNSKIDQYESRLNQIFEKDNALYLPIVGENIISKSRWMAGTGGSAIFDKSINNAAFKTELRISGLKSRLTLLNTSLDAVHKKANVQEVELLNMPSILPTNGTLISGFGYRTHPVLGHSKFHEGLDFACQTGTPIYASGNAIVETADYNEHGYGININLDHQNGYRTKYAHLSELKVKQGQKVKRGQLIGYSGSTGMSSGPHLHYEVSYNNVKTDPIDFIYMDLSPQEYRRLKLDKSSVTKEAVKEKLVAPSMD